MKWNDFLNPRSMLTPGVAGSVVMVIANTLWVEFLIPQKWTALILSFLLIIPILLKFSASWIENIIYFTFNGLIVFALAVNTNFAGRKIQEITSSYLTTNQAFSKAINTALSSEPNTSLVSLINTPHFASNSDGVIFAIKAKTAEEKQKKKIEAEKDKKDKLKKQEKREFFEKWF